MKRSVFNKLLLVAIFGVVFMQPAYAYLDPGTGSCVIQVLIAVFAGFIVSLKLFWNNVKTFWKSIFSKEKE